VNCSRDRSNSPPSSKRRDAASNSQAPFIRERFCSELLKVTSLAAPDGFEPSASRLGGALSIQLSYGDDWRLIRQFTSGRGATSADALQEAMLNSEEPHHRLRNVAVTDLLASIVTVQTPVPEHPPPLHPRNVKFSPGVAVSVTIEALTYGSEQSEPH
jgi:hypothetical protein